MIRLVVFDLAGTTVRDDGHVAAAFTEALAADGIAITPGELGRVRGASKREAVRRLVPDGPGHATRAERVYADFRARLSARLREPGGVAPIDGAERVFRWLRARGVRVALNTGFDRDITSLVTRALAWDSRLVDAVVCGDDVREGRPAPFLVFHAMEATGTTDVKRVANVGDTTLDLEAGFRADVGWNVGVLTGAHDRARLAAAPHTHILDSIAELPGLFAAE